jgi:predicted transposase/invertase (TIGR01784 family)
MNKMERTIISFDYAIKDILRDKANFDILSGFLTELLCKPVSVQEILESEGNPGKPKGKTNRLDLKAKIDDGELAVFEIQYQDQIDFIGKVLFNTSKAVVEQVSTGEPYDVKKVYSINIAYNAMGADKEYVFVASLNEFKGTHFDETIPFAQNLEPLSKKVKKDIHPEYFLILPKKFDEQIRTKFDEWVYVLKKSSVKSDFTAAGVQEAGERLDVMKMTPEERAEYEREKREETNHKTQILTAEIKGVEKGKIEVAQKLLQKGMSIEDVSDVTGLSPEQITEIANSR